jgi:WhiB family redox-sensing transcriptional regulator
VSFYQEINWEAAACRGIDTDMFYRPEEVRKADPVLYLNPIRNICVSCPIWAECLAYATSNEIYGIWGGMTTFERQSLQRKSRNQLRTRVISIFASLGISKKMIYEALEVSNGVGKTGR